MAGKKGRSGRKPRDDGMKSRAVNLYIPMRESYGWNSNSKTEWIPEDWFRQFKRIYGNRWQEKVRSLMLHQVRDYETNNMWDCECKNRLLKYHFRHEAICPRCNYEPYDLQRYKTQAQVRAHAKDDPRQKKLSMCPTCGDPLTREMDVHGRQIMKCRTCHP